MRTRPAPEFARPIEAAQTRSAHERVIEIVADAGGARGARASASISWRSTGSRRRCACDGLGGGLIRLSAELDAEVMQACVVTLEPVASRVEEEFSLLYGGVEETREVVLDAEAEIVEPLEDGVIDIGEAVAQQLSLALDPFPRAPEALALPPSRRQEPPSRYSPFAVL